MDTLYHISLFLHSWNRWLILLAGILVIIFAISGLTNRKSYSDAQRKLMLVFIISLHTQLLIGLLQYFFLSPFTAMALRDFGAAMKDSTLRFWAVEHTLVNVIAIALAQTGSILLKKRTDDRQKHRTALIWTSIAIILILLVIPTGMMGVERPWFRF